MVALVLCQRKFLSTCVRKEHGEHTYTQNKWRYAPRRRLQAKTLLFRAPISRRTNRRWHLCPKMNQAQLSSRKPFCTAPPLWVKTPGSRVGTFSELENKPSSRFRPSLPGPTRRSQAAKIYIRAVQSKERSSYRK